MIADALNMSKSYVSHLFKDMTGFTVMEYVMGCRLTHAKYLLEMKPDKKIAKVAYESGFESASHFSRYFRQKTGLTDRKSTRLNSSHVAISYAVFCLNKKKKSLVLRV